MEGPERKLVSNKYVAISLATPQPGRAKNGTCKEPRPYDTKCVCRTPAIQFVIVSCGFFFSCDLISF